MSKTNTVLKNDVNEQPENGAATSTEATQTETTQQAQQPASKPLYTADQQAIIDGSTTKSFKIRALLASGLKRGEVAKALNIRYQFVRNVEITPLAKKAA